MLYKEFISALVMTGIITAFAIPMTQLSGESQVVPLLLLICMGIFNVGRTSSPAALRGQNRREDDHEGLSAPSRGRALRPHRPVSALPGNPGLLHRRIPLFHRRLAHRPAHEDHAEACRQACRRLLRLHRLLVLPVHRTAGPFRSLRGSLESDLHSRTPFLPQEDP